MYEPNEPKPDRDTHPETSYGASPNENQHPEEHGQEFDNQDTSFAAELEAPKNDVRNYRLIKPTDQSKPQSTLDEKEQGAEPSKGFFAKTKERFLLMHRTAKKALGLALSTQKKATIATSLLRLADVANAYVTPVLSGGLVGSVIASAQQGSLNPAVFAFGAGLICYELLSGVSQQFRNYFQRKLEIELDHQGRQGLLDKARSLTFTELRSENVLPKLQKLRTNMHRVRRFTTGSIDLAGSGLTLSAALYGMGQVSPTAAAILGATMIPMLWVEGRRAKIDSEAQEAAASKEDSFWPLHWAVTNPDIQTELRVQKKAGWAKDRLRKISKYLISVGSAYAREDVRKSVVYPVMNAIGLGGSIAMLLKGVASGSVDAAGVTQFLVAAGLLRATLQNTSQVIGKLNQDAEYVDQLISTEQDDAEARKKRSREAIRAASLLRKGEVPRVHFKGVKYAVEGTTEDGESTRKVILDIPSFELNPSEFVGIVGKKGAGKSTFLNLLLGIIEPTEGSIELEFAGGTKIDLAEMPKSQWHRTIGYLPQEYYKAFGLSIEESVGIGSVEELDELELCNILVETGAIEGLEKSGGEKNSPHDWIIEDVDQDGNVRAKRYHNPALTLIGDFFGKREFDLPESIKRQMIKDGVLSQEEIDADPPKAIGKKFSGGELQLIGNARALAGRKSQIVLDEPASNLDPESEKRLIDYVASLKEQTRLVVSHRYTSFQGVDRIIVFSDGMIEDEGTPEELLRRKDGTFYKHFMLQVEGLPGAQLKDGDISFE